MIELLIKIWYRQQKLIDEFHFFKFILILLMFFILSIVNVIFYYLLNFNNQYEQFIMLNLFLFFLTQYNTPVIIEEFKSNKITSMIILKKYYNYIGFLFIKRNPLISIFLLTILINLVLSLFSNPIKVIMIILCLFTQINLIVFKVTKNKYKLILIFIELLYLLSLYKSLGIFVYLFIIIVNSLIYFNLYNNKFIYSNNTSKVLNSNKSKYSSNNFLNYLFIFLKRINKKEYIDILISILLSITLYRFTGKKTVDYLLVFFFIAKIQLILESQQINYRHAYLKNIFSNVINMSTYEKIMYSKQFKAMILEVITVLLVTIFIIYLDKKLISSLLWGFNLVLLMYLNLDKMLRVFYYHLDNKQFYKGTALNFILIYIVLFIINLDFILKFVGFDLNILFIEFIKMIFITIFIKFKFEKLFMPKDFKGKNEYEI